MRPSFRRLVLYLTVLTLTVGPITHSSRAEVVMVAIPVGSGPWGISVDRGLNEVYLTNAGSNTVSVINGSSNAVLSTILVGLDPRGIDLNAASHIVYVANYGSNSLSVIDGLSNRLIANVSVGMSPYGVGVNSITNKVYVANSHSNNVSVVDDASNTLIRTIPVGSSPSGVAVNPQTDRIYVTNLNDNTVSVIDGSNDSIIATVPVGFFPLGVSANPATNMIYAVNQGGQVSVIDGSTNMVTATVTVGANPVGAGVNNLTNRAYVSNYGSNTVSVIDGSKNTVVASIVVGTGPNGIGVDSVTDMIYVANNGSNTVSVISGHSTSAAVSCTPSSMTVATGGSCEATVTDKGLPTASAPSGSVSFFLDSSTTPFGSCPLGSVNSTTSICSSTFFPTQGTQGTHTIKAVYGGDVTHPNGSAATTVTIFDFSISNSGGIVEGQNSSLSNRITISLVSGSPQSVSLACTGDIPPGANCIFSPSMFMPSFSSTLTVATSSTPVGSYIVNVTGTGAGQIHMTNFVLTVQPFDFSVSNPGKIACSAGCSMSTNVTVTLLMGTVHNISLACVNGVPAGVSCSFNPQLGLPTFSTVLSFNTSSTTTPGSYTVTIAGSGGGQVHNTTFIFKVCASLAGDVNGDCRVDIVDLAIVGAAYGSTPSSTNWNPKADLNGDSKVDIVDLALVAKNYRKSSA